MIDMKPLLPAPEAEKLTEESTKQLFENVFSEFIERVPGDPRARTDEKKSAFSWAVEQIRSVVLPPLACR
jgi:hypothetical protein